MTSTHVHAFLPGSLVRFIIWENDFQWSAGGQRVLLRKASAWYLRGKTVQPGKSQSQAESPRPLSPQQCGGSSITAWSRIRHFIHGGQRIWGDISCSRIQEFHCAYCSYVTGKVLGLGPGDPRWPSCDLH